MSSSLSLRPDVRICDPQFRNDVLFHWFMLLACGGVLLAAALLRVGEAGVVVPTWNWRLPELCTLRRLTGISCPGCGLTRCFISLAHGDLAAAWSFNPAGILLFAIVAAQLPLRGYQLWRIRRGRGELVLTHFAAAGFVVFFAALLGQWGLRLLGVGF